MKLQCSQIPLALLVLLWVYTLSEDKEKIASRGRDHHPRPLAFLVVGDVLEQAGSVLEGVNLVWIPLRKQFLNIWVIPQGDQ